MGTLSFSVGEETQREMRMELKRWWKGYLYPHEIERGTFPRSFFDQGRNPPTPVLLSQSISES